MATGSPSTQIALTAGAFRRVESDLAAEARAQPARDELRIGPGPLDAQLLDRRDSGPQLGEPAPPQEASASRRCPRRPRVRRAGQSRAYAAGAVRHSDESTTSLSGDAGDLRELVRFPGGLAAPPAEDGEVGDEQRQHDRGGMVGPRCRAGGARSPRRAPRARGHGTWKSLSSAGARSAARGRAGDEEDRACRMPFAQPGQRRPRRRPPSGRAPDEVGHRARPQLGIPSSGLARTEPRKLAIDLADDAHGRP